MAQFDYVSDLHIDYWDPKWKTSFMSCGLIKNRPLDWKKMKVKSDVLVVAGDVSDNLEFTIKYLKSLRKYYKKILFVDGNHEHVYRYPRLYSNNYIYKKFKGIKNIHYIPEEDFVIGKTVFIGFCGWWNYSQGKEKSKSKKFSEKDKESIIRKAKLQAEKLNKKIKKYQRNKNIDDIVIVTHTIPNSKFARYINTDSNSFFEELELGNKVKRWVFGHVHTRGIYDFGNIKFLINCRGRPDDNIKEPYSIKTSKIN